MQIIIPMSGFGERFRREGYKVPKPLIKIDKVHMIGHVINLFPGEKNIMFICNKEHLNNKTYNMRNIIRHYLPEANIVGIDSHKLGPIHTVLMAEKYIDLNEPVVVNYCDFSCYWDWNHFKKFVKESKCNGAIPAYKGFHPHSLGKTNYAYIKEKNNKLIDIQEKKPFTKNRMQEYASSGTYYFANGDLLLESFKSVVNNKNDINGEYYVSLAYKELLERKLNILIYNLQHFFQWGTPEDLEDYLVWSQIFKNYSKKNEFSKNKLGTILIPMAGLGKRFQDEGYIDPKPTINVSGQPMIMQVINHLPSSANKVFVIRKDMKNYIEISEKILDKYPEAKFKLLSKLTKGQAESAYLGLDCLKDINNKEPLTIASCDNGIIFDTKNYESLLKNNNIDIIVWGYRNHFNAKINPNMFGWIDADKNGRILNVSSKIPINNDLTKPILVGTFTFKKLSFFENSFNRMIKREGYVNNEYYIDESINDAIKIGYRCHLFEVNSFISWGTPNELKTFEYWQSCLHKWEYHPYNIDFDEKIPYDQKENLKLKYIDVFPKIKIKNKK